MPRSKKPHPEIVTERLCLRPFAPRDAEGLHACFGDEAAMRFWNFPACKTKAESERWVRILAKTTSPYDYLAWCVAEKDNDHCIGMVNYHHREARNDRLEIGYILAPASQGQGLMTEAVGGLLDYCFAELGAHRIEALIHPDNAASIRLVERLGFRFEGGPLRDYWRVGDGYLDVMVYGLIDGDRPWPAESRRQIR